MPWTFLAVLALSPACVAAYITFSTINLREGIIFQHNLTTGQITINSPDQQDWILCDLINYGNISANIGGVTTYYNLSDPFVYRQTKPLIEFKYNVATFNSTNSAKNGSNGWFQVDDTRYLLPYGDIGTESPIAVNMQEDVLKLETSMADVKVQRTTNVPYTKWIWNDIEGCEVELKGNAVFVEYPGENRTFLNRHTVINYYPGMVDLSTSNKGSYVFDLKARSVKFTTHAGRVYNFSNGEKTEISVKFGVATVSVSNRGPVRASHVIKGKAVYAASLYHYIGGNLRYSYHYDLNTSTVQLMRWGRTVITVDVRNMTVEGLGQYVKPCRMRRHGESEKPKKVWISEEFRTTIRLYKYRIIKIDGRWNVEIGGTTKVETEHGAMFWLYKDGLPKTLNYWMSGDFQTWASDEFVTVGLPGIGAKSVKDSIEWTILKDDFGITLNQSISH